MSINFRRIGRMVAVHTATLTLLFTCAVAQSDTATLSGRVVDPEGLNIKGAHVVLIDMDRGNTNSTQTNNTGLYVFSSVRPGHYRLEISAAGFRTVNFTGLTVNIQDSLEQNFKLAVGSALESVTVEAAAAAVEDSAVVSTVIDSQFVKELPLNGRSFQTLFQLTPGVVITNTSYAEQGQFSVNGQRTNTNYVQVDGVSGNVAAAAANSPGQSIAGSLPALSAAGGTASLVAADALQEFVIQTSGYAPEFGRTPGAQVAITTRSGTNGFHADLFEYFRNDKLDANDWFANHNGLKRADLRQNDFGGAFSGPVQANKTFFFLSYEGLRLRQPNTGLSEVPTVTTRQAAPTTIQPFLNAFPLPTAPDEGNGMAPADYSFSDPSQLDAASLRIDHHFTQSLSAFARYNYSSSYFKQRTGQFYSLATVEYVPMKLHTSTAGLTWSGRPNLVNDFRFNWSWSAGSSLFVNDSLGGAVPLSLVKVLPSSQDLSTSEFSFGIDSGLNANILYGLNAQNIQRQLNVVDTLSWQKGAHLIKGGIDYRRLKPRENSATYFQGVAFATATDTVNDVPEFSDTAAFGGPVNAVYVNYSLFVQDTWKMSNRLTTTYGVRWDYNPAPQGRGSTGLLPITMVTSSQFSSLSFAPVGSAFYHATLNNFAPRLGVTYNVLDSTKYAAVIHSGFGIFYDLGNGTTGNVFNGSPFSNFKFTPSPGSFPLTPTDAAPPPLSMSPPYSVLWAFPKNLRQPYTYHWNSSWEQSLGAAQLLSVGYLGSAGHSLLRQETVSGSPPLPNEVQFVNVMNQAGYSNYNALQAQFRRRQSLGLEVQAAYTYAHSLDNVSAETVQNPASVGFSPDIDYASSDFDIRHTGSIAIDYEPPFRAGSRWVRSIVGGWGVSALSIVRTPPTVNVTIFRNDGSGSAFFRPDIVPGEPFHIPNNDAAGDIAINPSAFSVPNAGQGDLARNAFRGFSLFQQDFSVRRSFHITERLRLQARLEAFNVLNHPNFASPSGLLGRVTSGNTLTPASGFGVSQGTFATGTRTGGYGSGFSPLYQIGGPRSLQLALKLEF